MQSDARRKQLESQLVALQVSFGCFIDRQELVRTNDAHDAHALSLCAQYKLIFWENDSIPSAARRSQLRAAADALTPAAYDAVVEERAVNKRCGYALCENALPTNSSTDTRTL